MKFNYFIENAGDEADALYELEQEGFKWGVGENPTALVISRIMGDEVFPYTISKGQDKKISWYGEGNEGKNEMNKYSVRQSIMYDLKNWKEEQRIDDYAVVSWEDFKNLPDRVLGWQLNTGSAIEANKRLIAIINWLNGEDVFSVDAPSYIVRKKGVRKYVNVEVEGGFELVNDKRYATVFYRLEDAKEYENAIFEAVELDE